MNDRRRRAAAAATLTALFLSGCAARDGDRTVPVMVAEGEGYRILSENPLRVLPGGDAAFEIELLAGYTYIDPGAGASYADGILTVNGVRYPATLTPDVRESAPEPQTAAPETTAQPEPLPADPAEAETVLLVYHANGGECTLPEAENGILYDDISVADYKLPNCRGDLGYFVREGYHLVEYNTKPDGTGQGYSLGSKILVNTGITKEESAILYCIWLRETDASLFTYEEKDGEITITGYSGGEETLVIPAYIDEKPVTVIEQDAFRGGSFTTLSLPTTLTRIGARAFANCANLQTVYFPDTIMSTQDTSFAQSPFPNFYLNAAAYPRFHPGVSKKFEAVVTTQDKNRIIVVSGSSSQSGLDALQLQEAFDDAYYVVNYGTNASALSTMYQEMFSFFVHEGDIVVAAPECSGPQLGSNEMTWRMYRETESCYNIFRYIDASRFTRLFSAFSEWQKIRMTTMNPRTYLYPPGDSYTDNGGPASFAAGPNKEDYWAGTSLNFFPSSLPDAYAANLNYAQDKIRAAGAAVYVSFAPYNNNGLTAYAKNPKALSAYTDRFREALTSPVISELADYGLPGQYIHDSEWHPNAIGCEKRTARLFEDLRVQMIRDNLWKE